jgi:WD40 repeat protein
VKWKIALALACVAACVFLLLIGIRSGLGQAGLWAALLGAVAGIVAAAAAIWALIPGRQTTPAPPAPRLLDWWVGRTAELSAVVDALAAGAGRVGITTGLYGAGGFGKTTLALMACADPRVRRRFRGGVYMLTMGRDVRGPAAVAAKVNDMIKLVAGTDATFTDPQLAGQSLAALLDAGPSRLLVLDDVWEPEQLAPFTEGGKRCALLVTTRVPRLLAGQGLKVAVDQMTREQARILLTAGLPPLAPALVDGLLSVTGRWPLLLRLVSRILADYAEVSAGVAAQAAVLLERLREAGPAAVDEFLGAAARGLDVGQPDQRARAVRATIGASTSLLDRADADRFTELGVFAEDEVIPFTLIAGLWRATAGLDDLQAAQVCRRLTQLALVSRAGGTDGGITLHDVVREFLRAELGGQRLAELNGTLVDVAATGLPTASPLYGASASALMVAWWELGHADRYLRDHLIEHLRAAGRPAAAEAIACDLRWVGKRLVESGPAALAADLSRAGTPRASRLQAVVERTAHLLKPAGPPWAVADFLYCRVAHDPDWGPQVVALRELTGQPALISRWPLPDLPGPEIRRVLTGRYSKVSTVAIAPDGSWLAVGGDGTVLVWDTQTWTEPTAITSRKHAVNAVTIAPDSAALAVASGDGTVIVWDKATGQHGDPIPFTSRAARVASTVLTIDRPVQSFSASRVLTDGRTFITAVLSAAIAPDGSWLATGGNDGTVRILDGTVAASKNPGTRHRRVIHSSAWSTAPALVALTVLIVLTALSGIDMFCVAGFSSSGSARKTSHTSPASHVGGDNPFLRYLIAPFVGLYEIAHGIIFGFIPAVENFLTFLPGAFLILASFFIAGLCFAAITRPAVNAIAVAPDGSWLAAARKNGTVEIWDPATGRQQVTLTGHSAVNAVAIAPDGSWLASGSNDGTIQIWDPATGQQQATLTGHLGAVNALAIAPDGSWLATGSTDTTIRIWDPATGPGQAATTTRIPPVNTMAVASDGSWLATGSNDGTVRIWDPATGQEQVALVGGGSAIYAMTAAPDGSWLATGGGRTTVQLWDPATGQPRAALVGHDSAIYAMAVAPDGSWLATGTYDGTVRIWDPATGQEQVTLDQPEGSTSGRASILHMAVAPDGSWLAAAGKSGTVQLWDPATGRLQATLTDAVHGMAAAPDGSWLAAASKNGTVQLWDPATGKLQATLTARDRTRRARAVIRRADSVTGVRAVNAVAIAPDGSWLAAGYGNTIAIWDPATLKLCTVLHGNGHDLNAVAVAPDGRWLATGSIDGIVHIWETTGWQLRTMMRVDGEISSCAWLGGGALAVTGILGLFMFDFSTFTAIPVGSEETRTPRHPGAQQSAS